MLSSLTMVVTGAAVVVFYLRGRRSLDFSINEPVLRRDLSFFVVAYGLAMIAGAIPVHHFKWILSPCLLVAYGVVRVAHDEAAAVELEGETKPLYFHRHPVMPHRRRIILQVSWRRWASSSGRASSSARCSTSAPRWGSTRCSSR